MKTIQCAKRETINGQREVGTPYQHTPYSHMGLLFVHLCKGGTMGAFVVILITGLVCAVITYSSFKVRR